LLKRAGRLLRLFYGEEFVVDEPKEEIYVSTYPEAGSANGDDLISLLTRRIKEHEKMMELAYELQERTEENEMPRFIRSLLPSLDGFERILNFAREYPKSEEIDNWLKSVESLYFRQIRLLRNFGLKAVETVGKPVDLNYHEVVDYRPTKDYPHNEVIQEMQKGYLYRGKVLRDAKVVVACNEPNMKGENTSHGENPRP